MNASYMPGFSAEATLYRTRNRYRSSRAAPDGAIPAQSVVAALTHEDTENCARCVDKCNQQSSDCVDYATAMWTIALAGCALSGPFYPACAAAATGTYAVATAGCFAKLALCDGVCYLPGESCCPQFCGLGHCCSKGETCMPDGCCPSGRQVCGGECCAQGATCCVGACCGPGDHCCGNACCPANVPCAPDGSCAGFGNGPPPPPPPHSCPPGHAPCGFPDSTGVVRTCCPPGLQCCSYSPEFGPICEVSCIH
jgi:hypothetical protein